jgi:hypothetical protein
LGLSLRDSVFCRCLLLLLLLGGQSAARPAAAKARPDTPVLLLVASRSSMERDLDRAVGHMLDVQRVATPVPAVPALVAPVLGS